MTNLTAKLNETLNPTIQSVDDYLEVLRQVDVEYATHNLNTYIGQTTSTAVCASVSDVAMRHPPLLTLHRCRRLKLMKALRS